MEFCEVTEKLNISFVSVISKVIEMMDKYCSALCDWHKKKCHWTKIWRNHSAKSIRKSPRWCKILIVLYWQPQKNGTIGSRKKRTKKSFLRFRPTLTRSGGGMPIDQSCIYCGKSSDRFIIYSEVQVHSAHFQINTKEELLIIASFCT